jgi:hypothetical protein
MHLNECCLEFELMLANKLARLRNKNACSELSIKDENNALYFLKKWNFNLHFKQVFNFLSYDKSDFKKTAR